MKTKVNKKEIQSTVENAMADILLFLNLESPSKKTKKVLARVSKKLSTEVRRDLKKQHRAAAKREKKLNGKVSRAADAKSKVIPVN